MKEFLGRIKAKNTAVLILAAAIIASVKILGKILNFPIFTECIWKRLFLFPCIGCGYTRAFEALLHFDFSSAFYYHPLVFIFPLPILIIITDGHIFKREIINKILSLCTVAAFAVTWLVRLYLGTEL